MEYVTEYQSVITLAILVLMAIATLALLLRKPPAPVQDQALIEALAKARSELESKTQQLADAGRDRDEARRALSDERVISGRLETERDAARQQLLQQDERHGATIRKLEEQHAGALAKLEASLRAETEKLGERDRQIAFLKAENRGFEETLKAQRDKHEALKQETEANRAQFVNQFRAISSEILMNQGKATTEAQKTELEKLINPFKAEIDGLKTNIKEMNDKAEKERLTLGTQIQLMQAKAAELATEASSLAEALRGDKKRQGNWGETILERILEAAGLVEGTHFTRQAAIKDEDGKTFIPDIVVHLPGERDVVIDSKVTLVAYQDMVQAADKEAEEAALKRHVTAIKAHMNSLSRKSYEGLGYGSVDSVLMFLPVEGALSAALCSDPDLVLEAAEKRIHILTPSTLMPILKIVDHLWTIDSRNKNVDEIVDRAGKLHDKFVAVVESVEDIGNHLKKASASQELAMKRISTGTGNVLKQVDQLRLMGARSKKTAPQHLIELSEDEDGEELGLGLRSEIIVGLQ